MSIGGLFGGGGGLFSFALQIGMAMATGGASLAVTIQQMAIRAAVQMAIQELGQQMGLPQPMIDIAKNMAMGQMGGASLDGVKGGAEGLMSSEGLFKDNPVLQGAYQRGMDQLTKSVMNAAQDGSLE
jgi:hypothetical protein